MVLEVAFAACIRFGRFLSLFWDLLSVRRASLAMRPPTSGLCYH